MKTGDYPFFYLLNGISSFPRQKNEIRTGGNAEKPCAIESKGKKEGTSDPRD